jgi:UDP-N-acetylmuramate dehydrogenase
MIKKIAVIENKIKSDILLAPLTTFKIGGRAKYFIEIKSEQELEEAIKWAKEKKVKIFFLGGGSNVLINDKEIDGLVLKIFNNKIIIKGEKIEVGAGAMLAQILNKAKEKGLSGLEWAIGIPGTIGGAVRGNAGWKNFQIGDIIETVFVYDMAKKKFISLNKKECAFNYRDSAFKKEKELIIWKIALKLKRKNKEEISALMKDFINKRNKTQPKSPCPGCIFKNVSFAELKKNNPVLAEKARERGARFDLKPIGWAGWIIEMLEIKGKKIGRAEISPEHANFIVNIGGATADDVMQLISYVKQQARDKFKIQLEEEIEYIGF